MKVGFIGLGAMGSAMASNLISAGHTVTVWNRSPGAAEPLVSLGAKAARTPERAAQGDVLLSMLANDQAVRDVILDSGLLDAMDAGTVHINHATVSVALAEELAQAHAARALSYVAAPVFGRPDVAAAGKLNIVVAGNAVVIERIRPLLDAMAGAVWPMGDQPAHANIVKIAGNFMLGAAIESMAEASALVEAHGVSPADFLGMLSQTLFAAPAYKVYAPLIAEQRFKPAGFALPLGYKDINLALAAGDTARVPLPFASVLRDSLLETLAQGDADVDWSALSQTARRRANRDVK